MPRQQGVALVVSLVLLLAMTILAIATLSGTSLNEKRTSNAQQKSIAFEVAESAIASVWDKGYLTRTVTSNPNDRGDRPAAIFSADADTNLNRGYDQTDSEGRGMDLEGTLSVQYCGESEVVSSELSADESTTQLVFMLIDVRSVAESLNSRTRAEHVQRAAITSVKTNRIGDCPAP